MGYEQIYLDFNPKKEDSNTTESEIISYSETLPKNGESTEEYGKRTFDLFQKVTAEKVIVAKPTIDELNAELQLSKKSKGNEIIKSFKPKKEINDSATQEKINQMKSRKDLDY